MTQPSESSTPVAADRTDDMLEALRGLIELICPTKPGQYLDVPSEALYALLTLVYTQLKTALDQERAESNQSSKGDTQS